MLNFCLMAKIGGETFYVLYVITEVRMKQGSQRLPCTLNIDVLEFISQAEVAARADCGLVKTADD